MIVRVEGRECKQERDHDHVYVPEHEYEHSSEHIWYGMPKLTIGRRYHQDHFLIRVIASFGLADLFSSQCIHLLSDRLFLNALQNNLSHILVGVESLLEDLSQRLMLLVLLNTRLTQLVLAILSSVRVESEKYLSVAQWVLLLDVASLSCSITLGFLQHALDFGAVDQTCDVGVADEI